jgi:hypothetical protein
MFLAKNKLISFKGSKVPFCQKWKIANMALLNPCMKFIIKVSQSTKRGFSMNPSNPWKGKSEVASFFAILIHVQAVCVAILIHVQAVCGIMKYHTA